MKFYEQVTLELKCEKFQKYFELWTHLLLPSTSCAIKVSVRIVFHEFPRSEEVRKRSDETCGARHVPESQGITLEVDRWISFSIGIRAWEEFISVASFPTFVREISLNGPTDTGTRDVDCRMPRTCLCQSTWWSYRNIRPQCVTQKS